jgi:SAM-dependent methyltransferase
MTLPGALGQVRSLFPHAEPDWWKEAYNHIYLWTDGDCVESPVVTDAECNALLQVPRVQALLNSSPSMQVLDLCCGQGRHTINLAGQFPSVGILGVDQSKYLLDMARKRVKQTRMVEEGKARNITFEGATHLRALRVCVNVWIAPSLPCLLCKRQVRWVAPSSSYRFCAWTSSFLTYCAVPCQLIGLIETNPRRFEGQTKRPICVAFSRLPDLMLDSNSICPWSIKDTIDLDTHDGGRSSYELEAIIGLWTWLYYSFSRLPCERILSSSPQTAKLKAWGIKSFCERGSSGLDHFDLPLFGSHNMLPGESVAEETVTHSLNESSYSRRARDLLYCFCFASPHCPRRGRHDNSARRWIGQQRHYPDPKCLY